MEVDMKCPICLDIIREAFITRCGHSFCFGCIHTHLVERKSDFCPVPTCDFSPLTARDIFPNYTLNQIITARREKQAAEATNPPHALEDGSQLDESLQLHAINKQLATLLAKRAQLIKQRSHADLDLCADFLNRALRNREEKKAKLEKEMQLLTEDLEYIKQQMTALEDTPTPPLPTLPTSSASSSSAAAAPISPTRKRPKMDDDGEHPVGAIITSDLAPSTAPSTPTSVSTTATTATTTGSVAGMGAARPQWEEEDIFTDAAAALPPGTAQVSKEESTAQKKSRMYSHFNDLQQAYLDYHRQGEGLGKGYAIRMFHNSLSRFTKYSQFSIFAQLKYGHIYSSSIVSSIEFDRDDEYFATAGVSKKIKIYEYKSIVEQPSVEIHTPVKEMSCRSKISCLSWNPYIKERVACSDYEGIISVWDANTGQRISLYEEHEKRAWSVDFCHTNPNLLASGSDDSKVIIWSLNQEHSVATMDSKANVCCVKFNPESSNHIAFGSADHHIHYYDLRNVRRELATFKGHAKAVSYVRFLSADELISASTDSTLKLWSVAQNECKRNFTGHTNEKNFVGLSTCQDYIACGSENNAVYVYYKSLSKPVLTHRFAASASAEDSTDFVSSVCWKKDSGVLLAANSLGTINLMRLV